MAVEKTRARIIELIRKMQEHTVDRGCTPDEAAGFAAKASEWIERYQVEEAELRAADKSGRAGFSEDDMEVVQNTIRTGARVFNPGVTQVVNGLAQGMCCQCILLHEDSEAVYGIVGETLDSDYVCQIASTVVPALEVMAMLEGREHGHEKAGLVRWCNQYLTGAGESIQRRLEKERKVRSDIKEMERKVAGTTLAVITGESIATIKKKVVKEAFEEAYPKTRKVRSKSEYDPTAVERGRAAGQVIGINIALPGNGPRVGPDGKVMGPT